MAASVVLQGVNDTGQARSYNYRYRVTLDGTGAISGIGFKVDPGFVVTVDTKPVSVTAAYNLQLLNDDGVDVALGLVASRSTTATERKMISPPSPVVRGSIYPTVTGGGADNVFDIIVHIMRRV